LARALAAAAPAVEAMPGVRELPGMGLEAETVNGALRLGSRSFCGIEDRDGAALPELWLRRPGSAPVRFEFVDALRPDAVEAVKRLKRMGLDVRLLSGDRAPVVAEAACRLGIEEWAAQCSPVEKTRRLAELAAQGRRVLMVGDGLNDAPALAAASASMSPADAADISQTAADLVWQGRLLAPVADALDAARRAQRLARQNIALAVAYNALAVPLAMAGQLTPLIAAAAMSSSSLLVSLNALRARRKHDRVAVSDPSRPIAGAAGIVRPALGA
jgi:Cu2+-exporting ATPase